MCMFLDAVVYVCVSLFFSHIHTRTKSLIKHVQIYNNQLSKLLQGLQKK
jgi:hypothetical protein